MIDASEAPPGYIAKPPLNFGGVCNGCDFYTEMICELPINCETDCVPHSREDKTHVIFVKVK